MYDYIVNEFWQAEKLEQFLNEKFDWELFAAISIDRTGVTRVIMRKKRVMH